MATIDSTELSADGARTVRVQWTALGADDDGSPFTLGEKADASVAITGTFSTATVTFEGSNDGTNWFTLRDHLGNLISVTAAGLHQLVQRPWKVRPNVSNSGTPSITAILLAGN